MFPCGSTILSVIFLVAGLLSRNANAADIREERSPVGILITSTSAAYLNSFMPVGKGKPILFFEDAVFLSQINGAKVRRALLFDTKQNENPLYKLDLPRPPAGPKYPIDEFELVHKLGELGVEMPKAGLVANTAIEGISEYGGTHFKNWFFSFGGENASPRSVLVQWGDPLYIRMLRDRLYVGAGDGSLKGESIYERHYEKVPFKIRLQRGGQEGYTTPSVWLEGLHFIGSRARDGKGFLWMLTEREDRLAVKLIELASFRESEKHYSIDIPAECFAQQVVGARLGYGDLTCNPSENTACVWKVNKEGTKQIVIPVEIPKGDLIGKNSVAQFRRESNGELTKVSFVKSPEKFVGTPSKEIPVIFVDHACEEHDVAPNGGESF